LTLIIKDNFLSKTEFQEAWEKIKKINFKDVLEGSINSVPVNIPFLKKKLAIYPNSDIYSNATRMDNKLNPSQKWHTDLNGKLGMRNQGRKWTGFAKQWIIYMGRDFKGGDLHVREGKSEQIVKPKPNRLVIIDPFKTEHKVDPVKGFRYSLNGFIYKYHCINN